MNPAENGTDLKPRLATYITWYNGKRLHSRIDEKTPDC
ncbi:hypothetical protein [Methylococcus sp. EFPC2]